MRKMKTLAALGLASVMTLSLAACGGSAAPAESAAAEAVSEAESAAEEDVSAAESAAEEAVSEAESAVEEAASTAESAAEAAVSEAASVASAAEGAADAVDEEAWKQEPAYGKTLHYWIGASCTAATNLAEELGYFKEAGLTVEGFKGESDIEAIGTGQCDIAIGHIAKATVPATNGVNVQFVGAAHLLQGCKALYVLADSEYQHYEDLKGTSISVPNGIGASDYNITARLLLEAGMNPLEDVTLTPVEQDACVTAMQNGEIQGALLAESFGYPLVEQGILRKIDSADGNSTNELCCIIMMNKDFVKENPITAEKLASCVKKALKYEGEHPEEATQKLMDLGLYPADKYDMNLELHKLMSFGMQSDEYATEQMRSIVEDYIECGLITATDNVDEVIESLWHPLGSAE